MERYGRFAIYHTPRPGPFADATAAWLGWDAVRGRAVAQPDLPDLPRPLSDLTVAPRKYGFHGTLKAPFALADGITPTQLMRACDALAASLAPLTFDGLHLGQIDGFLALTPTGDTRALNNLAADIVKALDPFRAPLTAADIARRNPDRLTPRQRHNLMTYGYPYVLDDFQFHLTLTGPLHPDEADAVHHAAGQFLAPHLAGPYRLQDLCVCGEDTVTGRFHLLHRYALAA